MSNPDNLSVLRKQPFSDKVGEIEELLASSRRTFLLGAGCSKCSGLPLATELTNDVLGSKALSTESKNILNGIKDGFGEDSTAQIEDYLSELVDLHAIVERREERQAEFAKTSIGEKSYCKMQLKEAVEQIKQGISEVIEKEQRDIKTHRAFVRALHRPIREGKTVSNSNVAYIVLNYDTLLEDALAFECIPFSDGIDGGATGWWNPATFNQRANAALVVKLHGSIDWYEVENNPLPRRIPPSLRQQGGVDQPLIIWPASTKYREAQLDPFIQLTIQARLALRSDSESQRVLVVCGYSFRDAHINSEIETALRESEGNLTMIVFSSDTKLDGKLKNWNENLEFCNQVIICTKLGFFHGSNILPSEDELPWWKFENVVRLLGGER